MLEQNTCGDVILTPKIVDASAEKHYYDCCANPLILLQEEDESYYITKKEIMHCGYISNIAFIQFVARKVFLPRNYCHLYKFDFSELLKDIFKVTELILNLSH